MVSFFIILLVVFVLQQQPEEFAKPPDEANLMRIRIETTNPQELMAELGEKGFDILYGSKTDSTFEMIVTEKELMMIKLSGLKVIWKEYGRPLREIFKPADQHLGVSALPAGYHGYEGIIDQMKSIASAFPDIAQVVDITTDFNSPATFNGQHIYGMKISDNVDKGEDEQSVLIVATTHAREIGTLVLALYAMDQLTTNYGLDALTTTAVNNNEIWIIPVLNPDGYEHVYNVNNMWRKNRRVFLDGFGVDLNRNFPLGWDDPCSGSTYVMYGTYKGPEPLSEAESQNIVNFYETIHFAKYIDLHSYGREVIVSYSNCSTHPWHSWLKTEAEVFSASLGYYSIRRPSASGEIYHWLLSRGVYAFLVEVGTSFLPPYSSALDEASQLWPGLLALIERVTPLKGHITNVYTGAPIVNAAIEYPGIAFSNGEFFTSGQHGRFHSYLPGGNYALKITSDGFFSHEQTVSVAHGFSNTLDIKLYPTNLINSVSCYQTVNKSLFQIEYINVLNWEIYPLPQNKVVVGYNIYEIAGGNNLFIQQVRDSVSSYLHRNQNLREEKVYGITTLYDDGYESPPCIYHLKSTL
jgi:predicted deacylase